MQLPESATMSRPEAMRVRCFGTLSLAAVAGLLSLFDLDSILAAPPAMMLIIPVNALTFLTTLYVESET